MARSIGLPVQLRRPGGCIQMLVCAGRVAAMGLRRSVEGCHAQTNTLLIFVAIACNFHEAPLLPFFLYRSTPKHPPLCLT